MKQILILLLCVILGANTSVAKKQNNPTDDRLYTIDLLRRIADPILIPLSENRLKEVLPRRKWETREDNFHTTYLQAFGRTLSGMAPWLALGEDDSPEGKLRGKYIKLARRCLTVATDPYAKDFLFMNPTEEMIVHACYVAYPLLVAREQLWEPLSDTEKQYVVEALKTHRQFKPYESNWLLFSSILECTLWELTGSCKIEPIEYAVRRHMKWYLGDGTYGDGIEFHWDYYNSYVIQPLLNETLRILKKHNHPLAYLLPRVKTRSERYATILEHMISPEGSFPVIGRSSVYRIAVFQLIGYVGMRYGLPASLNPGATRAALTCVIKRMMEAPGTFDENGYLHAGLVGQQEDARDTYNYTGALYMCTMGLSHLGIPADAPFWSAPAEKWTQQRIWSGDSVSKQTPYWDPKPQKSALDKEYILEKADMVIQWQKQNPYEKAPYTDWVYAPYLHGLMAMGNLPGCETYRNEARKIAETCRWEVIKTSWVANDHAAPQTWLELYELSEEKDSSMIRPTLEALDFYIRKGEEAEDNLDFTSANRYKWSWCDALYMSPPTFALAARITGEKKYLNYLHKWWWKVSDYYYNPQENLYFRDQNFFRAKGTNGKPIFWGRGNGWVVGGLVRVLSWLSPEDPMRTKYEQQLREILTRLVKLQCKDGVWHASLLDPQAVDIPETSSSSFIVYALAYAINQGIVDRTQFLPSLTCAWESLSKLVDTKGRLLYVQPIGDKPGLYPKNSTLPYGTGAFLLAASEIYRLTTQMERKLD